MEDAPAWSPEGGQIAFYRAFRGTAIPFSAQGGFPRPRKGAIYTVSKFGGVERRLTDLSYGFPSRWLSPQRSLSWSADGKLLAYQDKSPPAEPYSIYLLSVESGEKSKLTSPPAQVRGDGTPAFSPDGKTVAFVRKGALSRTNLYTVPAEGGTPKRLTFDRQRIVGLTWTPDSREIIFSSNRAGDRSLWRISVAGGTLGRLPTGTGADELPAVAPSGRRLAFTRHVRDVNIWRVEVANPKATHPTTKFIASTRGDVWPAFSPDGRRIAFVSSRSGTTGQVWVCDRDGSDPVQLTSLSAGGGGLPSWSPDGRQIALTSSQPGNLDVYVTDLQSGRLRQLTTHAAQDRVPSWSRDGEWIYFGSDRTGAFQVWKVPTQGGTPVQVTKEGGSKAVESADGKLLYYTKSGGISHLDVWRVPVEGGEEVQVVENLGSGWTVVENRLYFLGRDKSRGAESEWWVKFFDLHTGLVTSLAALEGRPYHHSPAVSPDGETVLYVQIGAEQRDLVMVENFQ